jgi:hypothetical protein
MTDFTYSLDKASYTWQNALSWVYFMEHCKKAGEGSLGNRIVHILIAIAELLPIIGQIASIFEKLIINNFSTPSNASTHSLTDKKISDETKLKKYDNFPNPILSQEKLKQSKEALQQFKNDVLSMLPDHIKKQQQQKTYARDQLVPLKEEERNFIFDLKSLDENCQLAEGSTFYSYNADGIYDFGWGCAWRSIQTCLSAYKINISFESLFHLFGPLGNLEFIYQNKYPDEKLTKAKKFAPYNLSSGWAEPFIGHMVMHFFNIPADLEIINGIPNCYAPEQVFHNKPLGFAAFRDRLENHFKNGNAAPIMIDDAVYSLNIIGIRREESNTILWLADPHINNGVNKNQNEKKPVGLYKIILDEEGQKINSSLDHEDKDQIPKMLAAYNGLHFKNKRWMALFPKAKIEE